MLVLGEVMRGRAPPFVQRGRAGSDKWRRVRSELGWPGGSHAPRLGQGRRGGSSDIIWETCFGYVREAELSPTLAGTSLGSAAGIIARLRRVRLGTVFGVASFHVGTRRDRISRRARLQRNFRSSRQALIFRCFLISAVGIIPYNIPTTQFFLKSKLVSYLTALFVSHQVLITTFFE